MAQPLEGARTHGAGPFGVSRWPAANPNR